MFGCKVITLSDYYYDCDDYKADLPHAMFSFVYIPFSIELSWLWNLGCFQGNYFENVKLCSK